MPRVIYVKKAQKAKGKRVCARCHQPIKIGDDYYWFANRIGQGSVRKNFCSNHLPRPSDTTTSDKMSTLYSIQERMQDQLNTGAADDELEAFKSNLASDLNSAAEEARDVAQEYEDNLSNMPEGLQNGPTGQDMQEKADSINEWADGLEAAASDVESYTWEPVPVEGEEPPDEVDAFDEVIAIAMEAVDSLPL